MLCSVTAQRGGRGRLQRAGPAPVAEPLRGQLPQRCGREEAGVASPLPGKGNNPAALPQRGRRHRALVCGWAALAPGARLARLVSPHRCQARRRACLPTPALITSTGCGCAQPRGAASPPTTRALGMRVCRTQSLKCTGRRGLRSCALLPRAQRAVCTPASAPSSDCCLAHT